MLGFNENPLLELEIRYWDTADFSGLTCPSSGVDAVTILSWDLSKRHSKFPQSNFHARGAARFAFFSDRV